MARRNGRAGSGCGPRATPHSQAEQCQPGMFLGRASGGERAGLERAWSWEGSLRLATSWLDDTVPTILPGLSVGPPGPQKGWHTPET